MLQVVSVMEAPVADVFFCKLNPAHDGPFEIQEAATGGPEDRPIQHRGGLLEKTGAYTSILGFSKPSVPDSWLAIQILCPCGALSLFHKTEGEWQ